MECFESNQENFHQYRGAGLNKHVFKMLWMSFGERSFRIKWKPHENLYDKFVNGDGDFPPTPQVHDWEQCGMLE